MARMSKPWRATVLAGVFVLAACEPALVVATPSTSEPSTEVVQPFTADESDKSAVTTVVASGLESLVVMQGPAGDDGLLGAGCVVESEEPLPDGDWFGFVLDASPHRLVVDIACVYGPGTDQFEVYSEAGDSSWPSYVVVNDVIEERELRFGGNAQAYMAIDNWQPRAIREVLEEPLTDPHSGARGVWMRVEDGRVSAVVQPYTMGVAAG